MLGVAGWRWLFVIQAAPALVLGLVVLRLLPDRPSSASWLTPAEREQLAAALAHGRGETQMPSLGASLDAVVRRPHSWALCTLYFVVNVLTYAIMLFLPVRRGAIPLLAAAAAA